MGKIGFIFFSNPCRQNKNTVKGTVPSILMASSQHPFECTWGWVIRLCNAVPRGTLVPSQYRHTFVFDCSKINAYHKERASLPDGNTGFQCNTFPPVCAFASGECLLVVLSGSLVTVSMNKIRKMVFAVYRSIDQYKAAQDSCSKTKLKW